MQIEIYTRSNCAACTRTKKALNEKNLTYIEHRIGEDITREAVIEKFPGAKTLPVVIIDGHLIGSQEALYIIINYQDETLNANES